MEIEGKWYLEKRTGQYLAVGQRLMEGDVIRILSPNENDHIVVAGIHGEVIVNRYCARGACARLVVPSPSRTKSGIFDEILRTAMRLIRGNPDRYSVHGVRGVDNYLEEAVCGRGNGSVDLTAVFRSMPTGVYYLKFRDLRHGTSRKAIGPLRFDWNPRQPSTLPFAGPTGIYEIRLLIRSGEFYESTPLTVWTLILDKSELDRTNELFRQSVTLTLKWQSNTTEKTRRAVLRAYLHHLAETAL